MSCVCIGATVATGAVATGAVASSCILQTENLVLGANGYPKVVDFGLARPLKKDGYCDTRCGTPDFMAPELHLGRAYR